MSAAERLDPPLDQLAAWHRLGEHQFDGLRQLARREPAAAVDDAARKTATAVVAYFDPSIALHHPDEERELFPALIESMAGSDPVCLREMIAGLTQEHRALAATWRSLRPAFAALAAGAPAGLEAEAVETLIGQCERLFRRKDRELLPMANRLLGDAERERIGAAMHARRRQTI